MTMPNPFAPGDPMYDEWEAGNRLREAGEPAPRGVDDPPLPATHDASAPAGRDASPADDGDGDGPGGRPSQATVLVRLARERFRLVTGDDGRHYAVAKAGASIARPLRGTNGLRRYLARLYAELRNGAAPSQAALADAMTVLEGYAADADPEPVNLRVAGHRGGVVVDLGGVDGRCVVVDQHGWTVVDRAPVLFRRTNLTSPMVQPVRGGDLWPLLELINTDTDRRRLLVGWLLAALLPNIPHPILAIFGEQGTGKSAATKLLVQLIDPSPAPLRSQPRDPRQWAVTANASWTVALENVSDVALWLSDLLCRAVTGDGHIDRALYSDDDVSVIRFRRVLALNSISLNALRGDLADRFLPIELEVISAEQRQTDESVTDAIAAAGPAALGGLLDLLVQVLAVLPTVRLDSMPRMADFARVLAALDQVTGWTTLATYLSTAGDLAASVVDSDPFAAALRAFIADRLSWTGSATDLIEALPTPEPLPKRWPSTTQLVSGELARCAPALRKLGYTLQPAGKDARTRRPLWKIATPDTDPTEKERSAQPALPAFAPFETPGHSPESRSGSAFAPPDRTATDHPAKATPDRLSPSLTREDIATAKAAKATTADFPNLSRPNPTGTPGEAA